MDVSITMFYFTIIFTIIFKPVYHFLRTADLTVVEKKVGIKFQDFYEYVISQFIFISVSK